MNAVQAPVDLLMIPIDNIDVLNPRERNGKVFEEIVHSIRSVGLKKPIKVTPRPGRDGETRHLLICGEGRMKAFKALGEKSIPAMVVSVNDEDAFIMSLAENIARRQYRPLELLAGIEALRDRGYDKKAIAGKTGLSVERVHGILTLLEHGEERLLIAVEKGKIPLTTALTIVGGGDDDKAVQKALQDAYESGKLRGKQLFEARRIIECRHTLGRSLGRGMARKRTDITTASLVRTYQKEVNRQKLMVKKAEMTQQRLLFVVGALRQLLANENFSNLLRAEGLSTLPTYLAERVWPTTTMA
ncbi:plasmid partitioning protein RepB C-terminal domain-containing protein [Collimonas humicola]|uniref:plasmid partitioning protein RepB C-terminal domain-containing protein n=1 Tax=Collimonas humicola TaxID=2825886 RepID=UPI001B8C90C5|nr:plasmid partitioning protein RepB C-terminal domain-containing protein [Collimonas humicola]